MTRIKSVSMKESNVKFPGAREHMTPVMEDGKNWDIAIFRLHHFEALDVMVFHREGK
jgi:hypothetical protein